MKPNNPSSPDDFLHALTGHQNQPSPPPAASSLDSILGRLTSDANKPPVSLLSSLTMPNNALPPLAAPKPAPKPPVVKLKLGPAPLNLTTAQAATVADISTRVNATLGAALPVTTTRSVPKVADISHTGGKAIESAVLYVDIRNSTSITDRHNDEVAAKIYKAFLSAMVSIARYQGRGHVRGFAGDRIMVIFDNDFPAVDRAVDCAVWMQSTVEQVLSPRLQRYYSHPIACGIGIDYSKIMVVRGGTVGSTNNDIVWAGKAANVASKLADKAAGGGILVSHRARAQMTVKAKENFRFSTWKSPITLTTPANANRLGQYHALPTSLRYRLA